MVENSREPLESSAEIKGRFDRRDEAPHGSAASEEWTFGWWSPDGESAGYTAYRLVGSSQAWYCWALSRRQRPLLHVAEYDIPRRPDPMIAKAQSLWAEYTCDSPFEQWTLGNETYAVELDDPQEALGRAYGRAVPIASDLEWYATGGLADLPDGYSQSGRLLGSVETVDGPVAIDDVISVRTHRWVAQGSLSEIRTQALDECLGPRLPFVFPDGTVRDLFLTPNGLVGAPADDS